MRKSTILDIFLSSSLTNIKGIPNGFPCRIASSMHAGCCETFGKRKQSRAARECFFYAFRKSSNIPNAWMTLFCTENHSVIVLKNNYSKTTENVSKCNDEMSNSHNNRQLNNQKPSS